MNIVSVLCWMVLKCIVVQPVYCEELESEQNYWEPISDVVQQILADKHIAGAQVLIQHRDKLVYNRLLVIEILPVKQNYRQIQSIDFIQ